MKAKTPLIIQLAGSDVSLVEWLPDQEPGIFSSKQTVSAGDSVKFKDETHKIADAQAAKIAELEAQLRALKTAEKT